VSIESRSADVVGTRDRLVRTMSQLMQRQGYEATGMKQLSREASATLGSIYHFFPGGKQALAVEAVRHADQEFADMLRRALDGERDPALAIIACARTLAHYVEESDWLDGCPLTATALETAGRFPEIEKAVEQGFEHWRRLVAEKLTGLGMDEAQVRELSWTVISTLEGAELLAQVTKSERPLLLAGDHLARLINSYR
jgi:AcrR family transcriptional regulator